jgi:hypothetical protein
MDTSGTMNGFLIDDFSRTGRTGIMIGIGNGKEPGASKAINLDRINRYRNRDVKDSNNINRGLRYSDIRNRCSNKDNSNKDRLMFNKHNISHRVSIFRDISSPNNILSLGAGSRRWNHKTESLKKNMNEGMKNIEGKKMRSLKNYASDNISPQKGRRDLMIGVC